MPIIRDLSALERAVSQAVEQTPVVDIHTHLFPPAHGGLLLWGVDELLTYHYLVAELFTVAPSSLSYEAFWAMPKSRQADLVWQHLFVETSPVSEARRGVLTALTALGLDPGPRDLKAMRRYFAGQSAQSHLEKVLELSKVDYVVMTNNPFVAEEAAHWTAGLPVPPRLKAALRVDAALNLPAVQRLLGSQGLAVGDAPESPRTLSALRGWLNQWADRFNPVYLAASLPNTWTYPAEDHSTLVLREVLCPLARERKLPIALMVGVRRAVNPNLREGGDAVGQSDVGAVIRLCGDFPGVKFLVTTLSRCDQHELAVAGRKFRNLHLFGCWWFLNNPSIIEEMTRQRLELLGTNVTLQHSDARVLDQLLYKWPHTRGVVAKVLSEKCADAHRAGWRFTDEEVVRDARRLLGGAFEEFLGR